jgi:hypothetical protein
LSVEHKQISERLQEYGANFLKAVEGVKGLIIKVGDVY